MNKRKLVKQMQSRLIKNRKKDLPHVPKGSHYGHGMNAIFTGDDSFYLGQHRQLNYGPIEEAPISDIRSGDGLNKWLIYAEDKAEKNNESTPPNVDIQNPISGLAVLVGAGLITLGNLVGCGDNYTKKYGNFRDFNTTAIETKCGRFIKLSGDYGWLIAESIKDRKFLIRSLAYDKKGKLSKYENPDSLELAYQETFKHGKTLREIFKQ